VPRFVSSLKLCISQIVGYRCLMRDVEEKRRTVYSSDNEHHEALLMQVSETVVSASHGLTHTIAAFCFHNQTLVVVEQRCCQ